MFKISLLLVLFAFPAHSSIPSNQLNHKLRKVQKKIVSYEEKILSASRSKKAAQQRIRTLKKLLSLQREEHQLKKKRIKELQDYVSELAKREEELRERIAEKQDFARAQLKSIYRYTHELPVQLPMRDFERMSAPKRKLNSELVRRAVYQIEILKNDLADAQELTQTIMLEKQRLAYLAEDLNERKGLLELHKKMQLDEIRQSHTRRLAQLEKYRKLKRAEDHLGTLISQLNARRNYEITEAAEREATKNMYLGEFAKMKGKLSLPIRNGKLVSRYGRRMDPESKLYVFKKGIEIKPLQRDKVRAVYSGKVVFSGELPGYGKVAILDHGAKFYSLTGKLGLVQRKVGEFVGEGDAIGLSDKKGTPIYFEIRSRNFAVNPLQWLSPSITI